MLTRSATKPGRMLINIQHHSEIVNYLYDSNLNFGKLPTNICTRLPLLTARFCNWNVAISSNGRLNLATAELVRLIKFSQRNQGFLNERPMRTKFTTRLNWIRPIKTCLRDGNILFDLEQMRNYNDIKENSVIKSLKLLVYLISAFFFKEKDKMHSTYLWLNIFNMYMLKNMNNLDSLYNRIVTFDMSLTQDSIKPNWFSRNNVRW